MGRQETPLLAKLIISGLNDLVRDDPAVGRAVGALIKARVRCADLLIRHPTIQVGAIDPQRTEMGTEVGFLGVLNGICGLVDLGPDHPRTGWGWITATLQEDGRCSSFEDTLTVYRRDNET